MRRMIWPSGRLNWYCPAAFVSVTRSVLKTLIWAPSSGRCVAASTTVPFIVPVVCATATRVQAHVSATQAPRVRSALVQRSGDFISTSCVGKKRDGTAHRLRTACCSLTYCDSLWTALQLPTEDVEHPAGGMVR